MKASNRIFSYLPKIAAALLVFINILILTKGSNNTEIQEVVAKFLTINGIISTFLGFIFFSNYFEAAENKTPPPRTSKVLIVFAVIALFFLTAYLIDAPYLLVATFLPSAIIYALSGHLDAIIVQRDATERKSGQIEKKRIIYRGLLVGISIVTLICINQLEWLKLEVISEGAELILAATFTITAALLWHKSRPKFFVTRYKVSLLTGNIFWNLPRILLERQGQYEEVLELSFLLAIGQGAIMMANYFYGVLLSSPIKRRLNIQIFTLVAMLGILVVSLTTNIFGSITNGVALLLAVATYALGGLLQTAARAKYARKWGNKSASTIYLVTVAIGFPLVAAISIFKPMAMNIMVALCFIQLLRSSIYEISSSTQRHE